MQEWCACGAAFKTRNYRRLTEWRKTHRHEQQSQPEPEMQGSHASTELSYQDETRDDSERYFAPIRLGFQRNA